MKLPSSLLENAVSEFAKLPGVGRKTALRLILHLLKKEKEEVHQFAGAIVNMRDNIQYCTQCFNVSDGLLCNVCSNSFRNKKIVCVVESIKDVIAIENTQQFSGLYHVLGGLISPLDGIGPDQLHIESLVNRVLQHEVEELIFALNPTIQGDTTIYYIQKKVAHTQCTITTIARGISFGAEIEFTDENTLAKSIANRLPVHQYVKP